MNNSDSQDTCPMSQNDVSLMHYQYSNQDSGSVVFEKQRLYSDTSNTQAYVSEQGVGHKRSTLSMNSDEGLNDLPNKRLDAVHSSEKSRPIDRSMSYSESMFQDVNFIVNAPMYTNPAIHAGHKYDDVGGNRLRTDFEIISMVGSGVFGQVFKVTSRIDKTQYAIKVSKSSFRGVNDKKSMTNEVTTLAALSDIDAVNMSNANIIRYYSTWIEDDQVYVQMELCENSVEGVMSEYILSQASTSNAIYPFTLVDIQDMSRDILRALSFLHRNKYVHLDIKPGNILIKNGYYKLCDFGLTVKVSVTSSELDDTIAAAAVANANKTHEYIELDPLVVIANAAANHVGHETSIPSAVEEGDSRYMARELLDWGVKNLYKCDMFSYGLSIYEVCNGERLPAEGEQWHALRTDKYKLPTRINLYDVELGKLLTNTLQGDPLRRDTSEVCLSKYGFISNNSNSNNRVDTASSSSSSITGVSNHSTNTNTSSTGLKLWKLDPIDTVAAASLPIVDNSDLVTPKNADPIVHLNNMYMQNNNNSILMHPPNTIKANHNPLKRAHTVM